ncbi:chromosome segregation protein SMC [Neisseria sp. N95_16]|uniref:Chromosome partition protein Smc n=1 Tax=Neisseria brasiliensis TaxID=2666100 RepID=A0A7X2GX36_9NEIS|nr:MULTISPECIES: chromosome segregation protein SMC [Neisseria]MRN37598.1 chromosome segregation protein SMC [Neisseria brasiliensis]PJO09015.1 chromosome segregation protein SMC [Neisseria sp. N95_16]
MRLTHIKLSGFKSFTDPTTIHLPGQLVAVIGPNGCGKSNVIDAVRWVLGEASAKQLRGESMQDVIFNGAATRRPAPRASVELVFDNSDHTLQGAWGQYAEVSIKRQLTRQGDSTYYINNQVVRRRDITDLFLGTGVGARGYAVIEQGMISRIIEARPEELRAYIEEAAGVSKYKERRKETEGRLKDTREHLQRLSDLQNELARQVEKLEKQAETAECYKALTAQLNQQQDLLDYTQWQQSLATADKATAQHQSLQAQQDETAAQIQTLMDEVHALQAAEQAQQQSVHDLSNRRGVLREQIARLEEQMRHQRSLSQRIERDRQAAQAQLQRIHQEQQQIRAQLEDTDIQNEEKQIELAELAMQVAEYEAQLPELEEAQAALNAAYQAQQDETGRIKRELALKQQQLAHAKQTVQQHETRKGRLKQESQALNLPDDSETTAAQEQAALLQSQQEHYEEQILAAEEQLITLRDGFQTASNHCQTLQQQHITLQAQQQALSQLLAQTQEAADFWQNTTHDNAPQLWQHISAPADWQHALSVILAERLHARAVPDTFNPPSPLPSSQAAWLSDKLTGGLKKSLPAQALLNQIQAQPPFQTALHHWLDGILCAPNLDYALAHQNDLSGQQIWLTPEGHQVDKVSVLLYAKPAQENLIAQKARLDELTTELAQTAPQLAAVEQTRDQAQAALQAAENHHKNLTQQQKQHTQQYHQAQQRAAELLARTNQGQIRREHITQELAQLEEEQMILSQSSDGLEDDIAALLEAVAELEHQQHSLYADRQSRQGRLKQAQLSLLEANRRYGLAEVAAHKLQQQKHNLQQQLTRLDEQTLDLQERQQELALAYESEMQDDEQHIKLEELSEAVQTLDEEYAVLQEALNQTQAQGREQYARQQTLQAKLPQLQAATQTALLQQQEALINAKRFHQNLTERNADLAQLETLAKEAGRLNVLNNQIGSLAQQIEALGAVNLAALQELEEARERDNYYRSQSEDVQAAIDLLEEAIGQIDDKTKARFKETFDAVNEKVQTFFPTLFGGGEAVLKMIGDDLLTAGVSIMARPPGKKNSTIHLLSGGEKALTAMSLVFALFSLNPAPFCLLDEVDAPLDDANTSRFCNLVKEMSAQTQFLYISHNRLTMEMAEQLVGVTMQEKGVSRIVSVDIQQALQMAEPA